ncbi:lysine-rich arabinogalactan protein 19-like [Impatiens glandulifera]|uniref:lysine-rich arabinogalactan protein 19-like n=1 Tax=Impatiens glandulifera TaxID=253017 RepID=UPI001FB05353|nr:lysine-rich arabinogalactan protein 19-like [Impatiens glandulifera]
MAFTKSVLLILLGAMLFGFAIAQNDSSISSTKWAPTPSPAWESTPTPRTPAPEPPSNKAPPPTKLVPSPAPASSLSPAPAPAAPKQNGAAAFNQLGFGVAGALVVVGLFA